MQKYIKVENGVVQKSIINVESQYINDFDGTWVQFEDGFKEGDLWNENDGFSHPIKTTEEIETEAREWRNAELQATDFIVPTTDYPNHAAWLTYRQELRDWTDTDAFPTTKPTKP